MDLQDELMALLQEKYGQHGLEVKKTGLGTSPTLPMVRTNPDLSGIDQGFQGLPTAALSLPPSGSPLPELEI